MSDYTRRSIGCVVPTGNAESTIAPLLEGLLAQTRVPDIIHVIVTHSTDATMRIASRYSGPHRSVTELGAQFTEIFVHDIGANPLAAVGALNYGYALVEGCDYLLRVEGGPSLDRRTVENLERAAIADEAGDPLAAEAPSGRLRLLATDALRESMRRLRRSTPWEAGDGDERQLALPA